MALLYVSMLCIAYLYMNSFVYYQLNKKDITSKYCINKYKKNSTCEGRCYLINKTKTNEALVAMQTYKQGKFIEICMSDPLLEYSFIPNIQLESIVRCSRLFVYVEDFVNSLFKPPCLCYFNFTKI